MKIILTGGAGYIGSHTAVELINHGYDPIIIDDFRNSNPFIVKNIEKIVGKKIKLYPFNFGDKKKLSQILKKENPYGIIHFAANKAVNESILNPLMYYQNNIGNLINMLDVIKEFNVNSFVFSSSCTVYGKLDNVPVSETANLNPAFSPYGYTKQIGEKILLDFFSPLKKTSLKILRYFNPIGAHPSGLIGELPLGIPNNLIPYITQTAIGKQTQLTIFGNNYPTSDGTCIRDYIHVTDVANAHVLSLKTSKKSSTIYNVGLGQGSSVLEIVDLFEKANKIKINYKFGPKRTGDISEIYASNNLIKKELNWKPSFSLFESLKHSWNWERNLNSFLNI